MVIDTVSWIIIYLNIHPNNLYAGQHRTKTGSSEQGRVRLRCLVIYPWGDNELFRKSGTEIGGILECKADVEVEGFVA